MLTAGSLAVGDVSIAKQLARFFADRLADFLPFFADVLTDLLGGLAGLFAGFARVLADLAEHIVTRACVEIGEHRGDDQSQEEKP